MPAYTSEILPYGIRAKGFTWMNFCVSAALFFNQYVNAIALKALAVCLSSLFYSHFQEHNTILTTFLHPQAFQILSLYMQLFPY